MNIKKVFYIIMFIDIMMARYSYCNSRVFNNYIIMDNIILKNLINTNSSYIIKAKTAKKFDNIYKMEKIEGIYKTNKKDINMFANICDIDTTNIILKEDIHIIIDNNNSLKTNLLKFNLKTQDINIPTLVHIKSNNIEIQANRCLIYQNNTTVKFYDNVITKINEKNFKQ